MEAKNEIDALLSSVNAANGNLGAESKQIYVGKLDFIPNSVYRHSRSKQELLAHFRNLIVEACQKSGWHVVTSPKCPNRITGQIGDVDEGEFSKMLGKPRGYVRFNFVGELCGKGHEPRKVDLRINFDLALQAVTGIEANGGEVLDQKMVSAASQIITEFSFFSQKIYQTSNTIVGLYLAIVLVVAGTVGAAAFFLTKYWATEGMMIFANFDRADAPLIAACMGIGIGIAAFFLGWALAPSSVLVSNAMMIVIRNSGTKSVLGLRVLFFFFAVALLIVCGLIVGYSIS